MKRTLLAYLHCVGLVLLGGRAHAQSGVKLLGPAIVNSSAAPVFILSVTGTQTDFAYEIVFKNMSAYPVKSFQAGMVVTVPATCGPAPYISKDHIKSFNVAIDPGVNVTVKNAHISIDALRRLATKKNAIAMMEQITILKVVFEDGHVWNYERTNHAYRDDWLATQASTLCAQSSRPMSFADGNHCAAGTLLRVQNTTGTSVYYCASGPGQLCTNQGQSCTSTFCQNSYSCPNQQCQPSPQAPPPNQPPSDGGSNGGACDDDTWYCEDDGGGDQLEQGTSDSKLSVPQLRQIDPSQIVLPHTVSFRPK